MAIILLGIFGVLYVVNRCVPAHPIRKLNRDFVLNIATTISALVAATYFDDSTYWIFTLLGIYVFLHIYDTVAEYKELIKESKEDDDNE